MTPYPSPLSPSLKSLEGKNEPALWQWRWKPPHPQSETWCSPHSDNTPEQVAADSRFEVRLLYTAPYVVRVLPAWRWRHKGGEQWYVCPPEYVVEFARQAGIEVEFDGMPLPAPPEQSSGVQTPGNSNGPSPKPVAWYRVFNGQRTGVSFDRLEGTLLPGWSEHPLIEAGNSNGGKGDDDVS